MLVSMMPVGARRGSGTSGARVPGALSRLILVPGPKLGSNPQITSLAPAPPVFPAQEIPDSAQVREDPSQLSPTHELRADETTY